jgi:uncharacterized iron-regulated protein
MFTHFWSGEPAMTLVYSAGRPSSVTGSLALAILALASGCASAHQAARPAPIQQWESPLLRDHPLVGRVYEVATRRFVLPDALVGRLRGARYVLIGEKHDNADHHRLEQWLIGELASTHRGLVFEMLDESQRAGVATLTAADSLEAVRRKLAWPEKGWDFAMYGPVIQAGLRSGMAIGVGNPSREEIMGVYRQGEPALAANPRFATAATIGPTVSAILLDEIYESHCRAQPREELGPMVHVQAAKDASMAHALAAYPRAVLIAGAGHANKESGVPTHLGRVARGARVMVVLLEEVSDSGPSPEWYHDVLPGGDYVWFTPKLTDKDYCEGVQQLKTR